MMVLVFDRHHFARPGVSPPKTLVSFLPIRYAPESRAAFHVRDPAKSRQRWDRSLHPANLSLRHHRGRDRTPPTPHRRYQRDHRSRWRLLYPGPAVGSHLRGRIGHDGKRHRCRIGPRHFAHRVQHARLLHRHIYGGSRWSPQRWILRRGLPRPGVPGIDRSHLWTVRTKPGDHHCKRKSDVQWAHVPQGWRHYSRDEPLRDHTAGAYDDSVHWVADRHQHVGNGRGWIAVRQHPGEHLQLRSPVRDASAVQQVGSDVHSQPLRRAGWRLRLPHCSGKGQHRCGDSERRRLFSGSFFITILIPVH